MKNSFLQYFSFVIAFGVLFLAALMLFGVIDVEHKGRIFILVIMAVAIIVMTKKPSDKK